MELFIVTYSKLVGRPRLWRLFTVFLEMFHLYAIPKVHVQDLFVKGDYDYQTKAGQFDIDLKTVGDYEDKKIKLCSSGS